MELLDYYPISKKLFVEWIVRDYGESEYNFNQIGFEEQCLAICKFLGQAIDFPLSWTSDKIKEVLNDYLYMFETVCIKYPYGTVDPLKIMHEMDFKDRLEAYPDIYKKIKVHIGLSHALVPLERDYTFKGEIMRSIKDALVPVEGYEEPVDECRILTDEEVPF